jgi:prepilin-type N-terminal cleavage/methylation domain-containing protein
LSRPDSPCRLGAHADREPAVRFRSGFTIVELLVTVSVIALLIGILLPAIGKARDQARLMQSQANLHQIGQAHMTYAAAWNDRQFTLIVDNIAHYGSEANIAFANYHELNGGCSGPNQPGCHPSIRLGRCDDVTGYNDGVWTLYMSWSSNWTFTLPINYEGSRSHFGSFRLPNPLEFSQYISGRFYDPVFYAPKDRMVEAAVETCREDACEFCWQGVSSIHWSSYCLSPAAMYNPDVMRSGAEGGWQDPWSLSAGFRSPSMSQARYPDLKTHMLEHHWLQNSRADCNAGLDEGTYDGCEPYYFNHSWESVPTTLFFDGHVEGLGVREAESADSRLQVQGGHGLWSRDTPFGADGYLIGVGYDFASTSYHIFTTDGIRGRDKVSR